MVQATTEEVWKFLGKDAFTKVRAEAVGTGNGTTSTWDLDHDNIIADTLTMYTAGTAVGTGSYSIDYDDGEVTLLTASASDAVTADYDYAAVEDSTISQMLTQSARLAEVQTGRAFESASTTEYLDVEGGQTTFFVSNYPVITYSAVAFNINENTETPDWSSSTVGLGNDYLADADDLLVGKIRYIDNKPYSGINKLRITYSHGYSLASELSLSKELEILLTHKAMINSAVYKAIFTGQDNFTPVRIDEINSRIEELVRVLKKVNIDMI